MNCLKQWIALIIYYLQKVLLQFKMQKNIFEKNEGNEERADKVKDKSKILVKKKKKKDNKVPPIQTQYQNVLSTMINKMVITPKTSKVQDIKVYPAGNKTYQEIINQAKKPRRMPPAEIQSLIEKDQDIILSKEKEGQQELIFHKPGTNILNNKNKKKKLLFAVLQKQPSQLEMKGQQPEGVFNKIKREKKIKQLQEQRVKQKLKVRPKTKEQLMIEFLKSKYNKNSDLSEQESQLAKAVVQSQYSQYSNLQPSYQPPPSQYFQSPDHPNQTSSQYQNQAPFQFSPQQQQQSPSQYGSQYPPQHAAEYKSQYLSQQSPQYPTQNQYQYNNQYPNQNFNEYQNKQVNNYGTKYLNQNQYTPPNPYLASSQSYPQLSPQFHPQNQPHHQNQPPQQNGQIQP